MIRVTIELLPCGDPRSPEKLETIIITNMGPTGPPTVEPPDPDGERHYQVRRLHTGALGPIQSDVAGVCHHRRHGAMRLAAKALTALADREPGST